ncbi:LLM class flavin-dependent oxidoreductase [Salinisphaera sp. Q1T1-3]|uniref:LLM class flavin-dependent oxidoreductase n=1 Tax=Salinisphaera sp. Q1T1-3 TaxID=2321229 RepID=UPI000E73F61B|nr:LLM class flavin-dependent oxidoreductase [Salinisphaera sp. Q1T1-3]RJS95204.1 LLM class flavin-dependent oxidoreductase [Salinisphaera sp. Q1T1-3]
MSQRIILNAFDMTCVSHQVAGTWRHPDNRAETYKDLDYWIELARLLESGGFDSLFIADVVGVYDVYRDSVETSLRDADQVPVNDPFMQISAMAAVTSHLGFGVTAALTYEQPYALARKFSTLDHLTKGRVAWNVVTSYLDSAAANMGLARQISHDERYDLADEFLDVTYKLWEGSWEDGAVVRDRERGVFTDAEKVHPISHRGHYFNVPGIHLCEPSPQRTPVIFQAGASPRGQRFAARHAEGVFVAPATIAQSAELTASIRSQAEAAGRDPAHLKIFALLTVITAASDAEAQAKYQSYRNYASGEGMLSFYGGWTGVDFSRYDPDQPLEAIDNDAIRSVLALLTKADPDRQWTPRDIIERRSIGGIGPVLVGGPQTVADALERWVDEGGVDGFNLAYAITPGTFADFISWVVPELRRRRRVQTDYGANTLRAGLLGRESPRVPDDHPAARYRGAFVNADNASDRTLASPFAA